MGLAYARVTLANPPLPDPVPSEPEAVAASGSVQLGIPQRGAVQLEPGDRDQVVPGSVPIDDMDLFVDPEARVPIPANPNVAGSTAVGVRHARHPS